MHNYEIDFPTENLSYSHKKSALPLVFDLDLDDHDSFYSQD